MGRRRAGKGPGRGGIRRWAIAALGLGLLATADGCGIGSGAIRQSRLKYNTAFQETEKQELLLNLVRLRYSDPIEMVPIASITTQFEFTGAATYTDVFGGRLNDALGLFDGLTLNAGAAERPTVAMSPRREQDFLRRSLLPLELEAITLLRGSGQRASQAMAMTVDAIDGLGIPPADPGYHRTLTLIDRLTRIDAIYFTNDDRTKPRSEPIADLDLSAFDLITAADRGYKFVTDPVDGTTTLQDEEQGYTLHFTRRAEEVPEGLELRMLLNLEPGLEIYPVEQVSNMPPRGLFDPPTDTIQIRTRSLYDTMRHLSRGIFVPEAHIAQGIVGPLDNLPGCPIVDPVVTHTLIRIQTSKHRPLNSAVAVKFRGHWFFIDDADIPSKETFRYMYLLIAAEVSAQYEAGVDRPILTIPLGDVGG